MPLALPYPASHSQITTYQECPLKYHYKYRTKTRPPAAEGPPTLAMQRGIEVHQVIERFLKGVGVPVSTDFTDRDAERMWNNWFSVCYPTMPTEGVQSEIKLSAIYHDYPISGYLDMFWADDTGTPPHTAYICDVKTGDNLFFLEQKMWFSLQPTIYGILVQHNLPGIDEVVWVQHNVTPKVAEVVLRKVELTPERERVLLYWLDKMAEDSAIPIESWKCGQCQFDSVCEGRLRMGQERLFEYTAQGEEVIDGEET